MRAWTDRQTQRGRVTYTAGVLLLGCLMWCSCGEAGSDGRGGEAGDMLEMARPDMATMPVQISIGRFDVRCDGCVVTRADDEGSQTYKSASPMVLDLDLTVNSTMPATQIQVQVLGTDIERGLSRVLFDAVVVDGAWSTLNSSVTLDDEGRYALSARITSQQPDGRMIVDQQDAAGVFVITTPDLTLTSVTTLATQQPPGLGQEIEIAYALREDQLGNQGPLQVEFFLITAELRAIIKTALANEDPELTPQRWRNNSPESVALTLAQVPPGALVPFEESLGAPYRGRINARIPADLDLTQASTRYLLGMVDPISTAMPQGVVPEVDDLRNNMFVMDEPIQILTALDHPDVVVRSLLAAPTMTPTLDQVQLSFGVVNQGGVPTSDLTPYRVYLSEDEFLNPMTDVLLGSDTVKVLQPGERVDVTRLTYMLPVPITEPARRYVFIWLDPDRIGEEGNDARDNNVVVSNVIDITGPTDNPHDIAVSNLTLDTNVAGAYNTPWNVDFTVRNAGQSDLGAFGCRIYFSDDATLDIMQDTLLAQVPVGGLLVGRSERIVWTLLLTPNDVLPGTGQLFVSCDTNDLIPESNETNNVVGPSASLTWRFLEPDFQLSGLSVTPQALDLDDPGGEDLTLSVDVCNLGTDPGPAPEVEFFLSMTPASARPDLSIGRGSLASMFLVNGQCRPLMVTLPARCESILPTYNVYAVVDPDNVIDERNEANNDIVARDDMGQNLVVTTAGGSCECPEDMREPNNTITSATDLSGLLSPDPLNPGQEVGRLAPAGALCGQPGASQPENDLYRIEVAPGQTLQADLRFVPTEGELDVRVFNAADPTNNPALPVIVRDAMNAKEGERATYVNTTSGNVNLIIAISADVAGNSNTYELELRRY